LQQQLQREQQGAAQRLQLQHPVKPLAEPPLVGQTVVVQSFKFKGNTLLSDEQLSAALAPLRARPLDFARLQSSAVIVADLYRDQGWVVQTFLPEQDIAKGEVSITIVEAVFGQTLIAGAAATRVPQEAVLAIFSRQQQSGQFLNINAVDRALLLADDLPGVTVSGSLGQGAQAGQTDLVLQLADEPWLNASISADNAGAVSTGTKRAQASLSFNSPAGWGDAISLYGVSTQGSNYGRLAYSLPLGSDGWRFGVNASRLEYELMTEPYASQSLQGNPTEGNSTSAGVELTYPVLRSRTLNLTGSLSADQKKYINIAAGKTASDYTNTPVSLGLSGNSFDALGGGGANALSWVMTAGKLNQSGSPTQTSDASTTQTAGMFYKVRYALSRQQQIGTGLSLYTAFSGQWAQKNLDSSEKFYLGGSGGVRAYPSSEGGGSLGQMLNVELRWLLPAGVMLTGFYDHGRVTQNVHNNYTGAPELNTFALKGAGLSLGWRHTSGLNVQATYARRIGDNPNANTSDTNRGADQDGTLHRNRLWLTASVAF
jgi:hemolysin activation/secretion protein